LGRWNDLIQVLTRQASTCDGHDEKLRLLSRIAELWIHRFANYNKATAPLEEMLRLQPDNREVIARLREIYEKRRSWKALVQVLERELALTEDKGEQIELLTTAAKLVGERLHDHARAIALWTRVVELDVAAPEALDALERLAERERQWPALAFALEHRQQLQAPGDPAQRVRRLQKLAQVYGEHLGDASRAAATWQQLLELDPRNGRALRSLREVYVAAQDFDALEALYARAEDWEGLVEVLGATAERSDDVTLKIRLSFRAADIYCDKLKAPHRAFRNYERILQVDPDNLEAARALVSIYERSEKWPRLRQVLELLLDKLPADAPASERAQMHTRLQHLCRMRLSDAKGSFAHAAAAFRLLPEDAALR
ncbi:MAG: tetratricopeptide repeat protein, partial [Polyangiales bacterium]